MTQDEIIEMARQADCLHVNLTGDRAKALERLEAFAKLVAEKVNADWSETNERLIKVFNEKADLAYLSGAKEEREACAKLADYLPVTTDGYLLPKSYADAIRARTKA